MICNTMHMIRISLVLQKEKLALRRVHVDIKYA